LKVTNTRHGIQDRAVETGIPARLQNPAGNDVPNGRGTQFYQSHHAVAGRGRDHPVLGDQALDDAGVLGHEVVLDALCIGVRLGLRARLALSFLTGLLLALGFCLTLAFSLLRLTPGGGLAFFLGTACICLALLFLGLLALLGLAPLGLGALRGFALARCLLASPCFVAGALLGCLGLAHFLDTAQ